MFYADFVKKISEFSYFKPENIGVIGYNKRTIKNQIVRWQWQGKILRLKRGIYTLNPDERRVPLPSFLISNVLQTPSYVSLESALGFYGMIPERVTGVTAVTVRKTAGYRNRCGGFYYRSIGARRFFGFESVSVEGVPVWVATPEKAVLDKIYYDPLFREEEGYFMEGLRLQNLEHLRRGVLLRFARRFDSRKISRGAALLADLVRKEKG